MCQQILVTLDMPLCPIVDLVKCGNKQGPNAYSDIRFRFRVEYNPSSYKHQKAVIALLCSSLPAALIVALDTPHQALSDRKLML